MARRRDFDKPVSEFYRGSAVFGARSQDATDPTDLLQFSERRQTSESDRCRILVQVMLGRAILDATGRKLSGEQYKHSGHDSDIRRWARNFFRKRYMEPFGWGWTIEVLGYSDAQARAIEAEVFKNTTDITEEAA